MKFRLAPVFLCLLVAVQAFGATFVVQPDRELIHKADAIVIGAAIGSHTQIADNGGVVTVTSFSVHETIKGRVGSTIDIYAPGGVAANRTTIIPGAARFNVGERVLLLLNGSESRGWGVTDLVLGKFSFRKDVDGRNLLLRQESDINGWDQNLNPYREQRRDAAKFLQYVRNVTSGVPAAVDYVVTKSPLRMEATADLKPQTNATFAAVSYTMDSGGSNTSPGFRWPNFTGNNGTWKRENHATAAANNGDDVIQYALNSWTNDPGSNISLTYVPGATGAATGKLDSPDGHNAVHFQVNLNTAFYGNIGAFTCSGSSFGGVIALGGVTNTSGSHLLNGESFFSMSEGDVDANIGVGPCAFFMSHEMAKTGFAHEIGHALGFRHSDQDRLGNACAGVQGMDCANSAIMFATVVQGLQGNLQAWDQRAAAAVYPAPATTVGRRGDVNSDGRADVIWRHDTNGGNYRWLMNGLTATNAAPLPTLADTSWRVVGSGDFDGDGRTDLFWRNANTGVNYIWFINDTTVNPVITTTVADSLWRVGGVGDFNGDGRADLIWRRDTGENYIWLMNGATVTSSAGMAFVDSTWSIAGVGDLNGGGRADIVWRNTAGVNYLWTMNGTTIEGSQALASVSDTNWRIAAVADLNGDGRADLFWRHVGNGANYYWAMNGATATQVVGVTGVDLTWSLVATGDFNGDGTEDLFWRRSGSTGDNYIWLMNGANIVSSGATTGVADTGWKAVSPR